MPQPAVQARLAALGSAAGSGAAPKDLAKALRAASGKQGATLCALGIKAQDLRGRVRWGRRARPSAGSLRAAIGPAARLPGAGRRG